MMDSLEDEKRRFMDKAREAAKDKVSEPDWKSIAYLYAGFMSGLEMRIRDAERVDGFSVANDIAGFLQNSSIEHVAALYKDR